MEENEIEAWVLDAAAHAQGILLWLKQRSGAVVSAVCPYHPVFYAVLAARNLREHTFLHETADVQYSRCVHYWAIIRMWPLSHSARNGWIRVNPIP